MTSKGRVLGSLANLGRLSEDEWTILRWGERVRMTLDHRLTVGVGLSKSQHQTWEKLSRAVYEMGVSSDLYYNRENIIVPRVTNEVVSSLLHHIGGKVPANPRLAKTKAWEAKTAVPPSSALDAETTPALSKKDQDSSVDTPRHESPHSNTSATEDLTAQNLAVFHLVVTNAPDTARAPTSSSANHLSATNAHVNSLIRTGARPRAVGRRDSSERR
ncbi:hypothetical protein LTR16_000164 [Cryomyces antarcticus]|uniref:Uncharacterized protein n=1 Tax=Cryomyces antarcticus TaxID=329879 RepID=A0ABR0M2D3_9PEZI|nr:hypothetical protein LTR39_000073 [Cryomyces antarcticus]KAK5257590.1 hypothetical protein LTR16_000164 [Cryomyces antarcticus]